MHVFVAFFSLVVAFFVISQTATAEISQNDCRIYAQAANKYALVINDLEVTYYATAQEVSDARELLKAARACEPSNCSVGPFGTDRALMRDGQPLNFYGQTAKDLSIGFRNLKATGFCK